MIRIIAFLSIYLLSIDALAFQFNSDSTDSNAAKTQQIFEAEKACSQAREANMENVMQICEEALSHSMEAKLDSLSVLNLIAIISHKYFVEGPKGSYPYANQAKLIAERPGNSNLIPRAYYSYCMTWERFVDMESSVKHLNEAIDIAKKMEDDKLEALLISGIGFLFSEAKLYDDAKKYFSIGLEVAKQKGEPYTIALLQTYLGITHRELEDYDKSYEYYEKASTYLKTNYNSNLADMVIYGQAELERKKKNFAKSNDILLSSIESYADKSIKLSKRNKYLVGQNFMELNDYKKANEIFQEVESELFEIGDDEIKNNLYKSIAICYAETDNLQKAIEYYSLHSENLELYLNEKSEESITTAELKYQLQTEESENKYLNSEKEKLQLENKSRLLTLIFSILALISISAISFYAYRRLKLKHAFLKEVSFEKDKINKSLEKQSQAQKRENQNLELKNKELSYFAGLVAHDIKQPIRTTSSFINLIKNRLHREGHSDTRLNEYISFIEKSNGNLNLLVDDLLEFTKSGQQKINFESINLNEIIEIVEKNLLYQISESSAEIRAAPLPSVMANKSEMIRLFQNIISNAIKFQDEKKPVIKITTDLKDNVRRILISDNGIGIDNDFLDKIFNPLVKLHSISEYEGSGLGLATCKKIVENLGGILSVESIPNQGSTFIISLPKQLEQSLV